MPLGRQIVERPQNGGNHLCAGSHAGCAGHAPARGPCCRPAAPGRPPRLYGGGRQPYARRPPGRDSRGGEPAVHPPRPGLARPRRAPCLGYRGGAASLAPAGLQDATPAEVNRPFTTGDRFWSGADGRGELQTENAAIRFEGRTSFAIQELSNQATLIRLESGTLSVRLHALAPGEDFEIETPQFTFHFNRLGAYRVEAGEKGDVVVAAVRFGDAEVFRSDGAAMAVSRGKQARAAAGGS